MPLKVSRTLTHSVLRYKYTTSRQTDLGAAVVTTNDAYSAGLEASRDEHDGLSVTPDWPHSTAKMVKMQWRYRKCRAWCPGGPPPSTPPTPLNIWKWRPHSELGFTKNVANNPDFTCKITGPIASLVTYDNTVTVRWVGWFSVAGVTLNDNQTQSTSTALTIDPDSGETARYCGSSSSSLGSSAFVREVT